MTKNIFITAVAVLLSVALCPLWAQNVSEDCKVGEFSATICFIFPNCLYIRFSLIP